MNITNKIQSLRIEKGWTVSRLARETNIPIISLRTMLNRQEPNNYNIKNLIKIADALGVTVSYLTLEDNESEKPSLTMTQREELKKIINSAIEEYFTLIKPNSKQERKKVQSDVEKELEEELED
ncbi:MAG: helix-turn-helix transcriptional regulator [Bacteroidales bacterium]|jgi:transcriptional regulator with XRE-family HTH domain|nr:helix-turn-helix transcriptional regulator [Bacteroidales bacterium]MBQ5403695.1 helix-turn-helix transcriptional regulator [Bacteroidales bacterium]MBR6279460.1 helix-turn-helix transcriptional regulator [Bacteroidales bacterium]